VNSGLTSSAASWKGAGIWVVALLLFLQLITQFVTNTRIASLEDSIHADLSDLETSVDLVSLRVASIENSDVLKLDAVMMRNSETWTLPVSSISWSGR
jgi:hypothetical protein